MPFIKETRLYPAAAARVMEGDGARRALLEFDSAIDRTLGELLDCPQAERAKLHAMRCLPQRLGGLGVYPHCGVHAEHGRNASRIAARAYIDTNCRQMFFGQTHCS